MIHPGTTEWFQTAKTGVADMLILGDSVVVHGGHGWDAGIIRSLHQRVGLAGTGLMIGGNGGGEGEGYAVGSWFSAPFDHDPDSVPADLRGYVWRNSVSTAGSAPVSFIGAWFDDETIPADSALEWRVYSATSGTGSFGALSRLGVPPYTVLNTLPTIALAPQPQGLQETVLSFPAAPGLSSRELRLYDISDASIFYSRVNVPGATGARVTSWGYGGHSALDFYHDQWNGGGMTAEGRAGWLTALTQGGSGKLNVVIAEGFNDRNESSASLSGMLPGNSPQAFADNITGLIGKVREDWAALGRDFSDLSFTLVGAYEDYWEAGAATSQEQELRRYAEQLAAIAAGDPQISFVNMMHHTPGYDDATALGYMLDNVHPTRLGALVYSDALVAALIPEPASVGAMTIAMLMLRTRRRRLHRS